MMRTILTALVFGLTASTVSAQDGMAWKKDYKAALEAAKKADKPLVVHFFTDS